MRTISPRLWSIAVLCSLVVTSCKSADPGYVRPSEAQVVAENERLEQRRLRLAGFEPLVAVIANGIEVQRVDPMWGLLDYPSVELTRDKSGAVTVALKFWGHERRQPVSPENWERLAALAPTAFKPADPKALERQYRRVVRKSGYCHGWHLMEANIAGRHFEETVSPCAGALQKAGLDYSEALIRVAIDNIDLCEPDRQAASIEQALSKCGYKLGRPTPEFRQLEQQL
jgi:hypothetical protein